MNAARRVLIAAGAALVAIGGFFAVTSLTPARLVWLGVWLAGAVIVHDGVLVPLLALARAGLRRMGTTWPPLAVAAIEVGFAVAGTVTLFVLPELWAQHRGSPNPTILQGDYAGRLLLVLTFVAVAVLVVVRVVLRGARAARTDSGDAQPRR